MTMAEQMQPMSDVPRYRQKRCPDCGVVLQRPWMPIEEGTTAHTKERCLEHQLTAARAEAERWQARYEALRAGVERVVQDLHERAHATARDWQQSGHPYHDGASDAYYEAARMVRLVRRVLAEAGGGDQ